MYKSIDNLKKDKSEELKELKNYINDFLELEGIDFFALTSRNGLIIEKFYEKEINERIISTTITKVLSICDWSISKISDLNIEESKSDVIEIVYRAGIIIIKQIGNKFTVFLLLKRIIDKNKLYLELNSLSYQINTLLGDVNISQISSKIDSDIEKLKNYIDEMKPPRLSEIKKMLKYIVE